MYLSVKVVYNKLIILRSFLVVDNFQFLVIVVLLRCVLCACLLNGAAVLLLHLSSLSFYRTLFDGDPCLISYFFICVLLICSFTCIDSLLCGLFFLFANIRDSNYSIIQINKLIKWAILALLEVLFFIFTYFHYSSHLPAHCSWFDVSSHYIFM